jgi:hypothetical protein
MQKAGAKIAQAIVSTADLALTAPMLRCGFRHVTKVQFLRHRGPTLLPQKSSPELSFEAYQPSNQRQFHETLERTYIGTLDIPELNGRRSIEEILAGHQNQGRFRPEHWSLAQRGVQQAFAAGTQQLVVAVDVRNHPARQLYDKMGFIQHDEREVLLFFFVDLAAGQFTTSRKLHHSNS